MVLSGALDERCMLATVLDMAPPFSGRVSGIRAVLGPLLLVADGDAASADVLLLAGSVAFVPAVIGLGGLLRGGGPSGPTWRRWAASRSPAGRG